MTASERTQLAAKLLALLGIVILVIGVVGMLAPPIITGLGFFVIAWAMGGADEKPSGGSSSGAD